MNRPKEISESEFSVSAGSKPRNSERLFRSPDAALRSLRLPDRLWKDQFSLVEPQITSEGTHRWPFDVSCPVDMFFMKGDGRHHVRMNRHGYCEVLYLCSGSAECRIQDRILPFTEGDLVVLGGSLYHTIDYCSPEATIAALFFEPDLIRCDGGSDSAEYLTPFLLQDSKFPHIIPASSGVPQQVLNMMLRIRSELPALSSRGRLALGTYLKMLLVLLVNHYASSPETGEILEREQSALDRLVPLFRHLGENCSGALNVRIAAQLCGMSDSYFMSSFKRVTGLTFMEYLNRYRIERAQAMLLRTDDPIASISQDVGYCDQSYFGVVFRKVTGMTPATYRRRFRTSDGASHEAGATLPSGTALAQTARSQPRPSPLHLTLPVHPGAIPRFGMNTPQHADQPKRN
jgi:AraC family transcriptional regulator, transcriptional activator of pobA